MGRISSNEEFRNKIFDLVGNEYEFLEEYIDSKTKLTCKHNICGYTTIMSPNNFINSNQRCRYCTREKSRLPKEKEILDYIKNERNDEYILLEPYVNNQRKA